MGDRNKKNNYSKQLAWYSLHSDNWYIKLDLMCGDMAMDMIRFEYCYNWEFSNQYQPDDYLVLF